MLKEHHPTEETARNKAARRWRHNVVRKSWKEKQQKTKQQPESADVVVNDGRRDGCLKRFEAKFVKDIRIMMEGHSQRNLQLYMAYIHQRKRVLLTEKLRRLEASLGYNGGRS